MMGVYLDIYLELSPLSEIGKFLKTDITSEAGDMACKQLVKCISHWGWSQSKKRESDDNFGYSEQPNSRSHKNQLKTPLGFV